MEDTTPYANSRQGLYWVGNRLFFYDLPIAFVTRVERIIGKNYWNVRYNLPMSIELLDCDKASTLEQVQRHVQYAAQLTIEKIKNYE